MKYNTTIENAEALPIPYAVVRGQQISAELLYKNKPLSSMSMSSAASDGVAVPAVTYGCPSLYA